MHIKIINPEKDGNKVYDNKGEVNRLVQYLQHELKEKKKEIEEQHDIFFNRTTENISSDEVNNAINNNIKGLKREDVKFETLVIAPSHEELAHIKNSKDALVKYTRKVMENYAENFRLKGNKKLSSKDLVWYAAIHYDREIKSSDLKGGSILSEKETKIIAELSKDNSPENEKKIAQIIEKAEARNEQKLDPEHYKIGEKKEGFNTHIHVIVSRRDVSQSITLNPRSKKSRFPIREFQEKSALDFQKMFGYEKETISKNFYNQHSEKDKAKFHHRIDGLVDKMNYRLGEELVQGSKMKEIGENTNYSNVFFINLGRLKGEYEKGNIIHDPYFFAQRGRDKTEQDYTKEFEKELKSKDKVSTITQVFATLAFSVPEGYYVKETMFFDAEKRRRTLSRKPEKNRKENDREFDLDL